MLQFESKNDKKINQIDHREYISVPFDVIDYDNYITNR